MFTTKSEAFNRAADAAFERRRREAWNALRPGNRITAQLEGSTVVVTVVERQSPDLLVRTSDGREHVINRYQMGSTYIVDRGGDNDA